MLKNSNSNLSFSRLSLYPVVGTFGGKLIDFPFNKLQQISLRVGRKGLIFVSEYIHPVYNTTLQKLQMTSIKIGVD